MIRLRPSDPLYPVVNEAQARLTLLTARAVWFDVSRAAAECGEAELLAAEAYALWEVEEALALVARFD